MMFRNRLSTRRNFMAGALSSMAAGSLMHSQIALSADSKITLNDLPSGLKLISGVGANLIAAPSKDGLLLVDSGSKEFANELKKLFAQSLSMQSVNTIFNTHWHPAHTEANPLLANSKTRIIAHENTKLWLSRKIEIAALPKGYGPLPKVGLPNQTFYTEGSLDWPNGQHGEKVDYGYLPQAHTDGDIYVFFRNANVIAVGGLVASNRWPGLDWETGGWIGGLIAGINKVLSIIDDKTLIITAAGTPITRAELEKQRDAFKTIYEGVVKSLNQGFGPDEAVAVQPAKGLFEQWGNPNQFVTNAFKSMWGHFAPDA
jgi:glyoxylase-like metal-dependent hydrolase (beta-lactamase superfamily II)